MSDIVFNPDFNEGTVYVMKVYPENVDKVWKHFSEADLLDQWWTPKPWKCVTKKFIFENAGKWLYAMVGPENEEHFAVAEFDEITFHRSISWKDYFSDSEGNPNLELPSSNGLLVLQGLKKAPNSLSIFFGNLVKI